MNDNSSTEFDNNINLNPEPPPPTLKLISAAWITDNDTTSEHPNIKNLHSSKPKVKLKTPLTDVHNNLWYHTPNGKWRPKPIINTTTFHDNHLQFDNNYWKDPPTSTSTSIPTTNIIPPHLTINSTPTHNVLHGAIIQTDSGANICATGDKQQLHAYRDTPTRTITGVNNNDNNEAEIHGFGFMYITTKDDHQHVKVKVHYSPNIDGTIISPQSIATEHKKSVNGWYQHSNIDSNIGTLGFSLRDGNKLEFALTCHNNLWYYKFNHNNDSMNQGSVAKRLSDTQNYHL